MRSPSCLWKALERIPALEAVAALWQCEMGDDWSWGRLLLRPTSKRAHAYPKLDPEPESRLPYNVVCHDDEEDDYVGVCPDGTGIIVLTRAKLTVLELDVGKLCHLIASALSLIADFGQTDIPYTWRVGARNPLAMHEARVYLSIPPDPREFLDTVCRVAMQTVVPCLVLTPTRSRWRALPDIMQTKGVAVAAIDEVFETAEGGTLLARPSLAGIFERLQRGGPLLLIRQVDDPSAPKTEAARLIKAPLVRSKKYKLGEGEWREGNLTKILDAAAGVWNVSNEIARRKLIEMDAMWQITRQHWAVCLDALTGNNAGVRAAIVKNKTLKNPSTRND
jgi:hypothetical protein